MSEILHRICSKIGGVVRSGVCYIRRITDVLKALDDIDEAVETTNQNIDLIFRDERGNSIHITDQRGLPVGRALIVTVSVKTDRGGYRWIERIIPKIGRFTVRMTPYLEGYIALGEAETTEKDVKPSELLVPTLGMVAHVAQEEVAKAGGRWEL